VLDHVSITLHDLARRRLLLRDQLGYRCVYRRDDTIGYGVQDSADDDGRSIPRSSWITIPRAEARHWALRANTGASDEAALRAGDGPAHSIASE
jgi:hypothetical protein